MATGASWMVVMRMFDRGLGVISTVILARLLLPSDYGLVAMAAGFAELLSLVAAFGFDSALIQRSDSARAHFDTAWTLNVLLGLLLGAALLGFAPLVADYFSEPRLTDIMRVMAMSPILNGFCNIGTVLFRKDLNFQLEAVYMALRRILGFGVTLAAAYWFRSYWALVAGTVATALAGLVLSFVLHPYRPRLTLAERASLFGFSAWLLLNNIIRFTNTRALEIIIAKHAGSRSLGLFSVANDIASLPTSELSAPINRALFPGYARFQDDDAQLRRLVLEVFALLALVALPAGVGIAALASLLVPVMLGANWLDAVPIVQILAFSCVMTVMQNNSYLVYLVKGRPQITTWIGGSFAVLQALLVVLLLPGHGVIGAATGVLLSRACYIPIELGMLMRILAIRPRAFSDVMLRPIAASVVMWWVVTALAQEIKILSAGQGLLALLGVALCGALAFALVVLLLWRLSGKIESGERLLLKLVPGGSHVERVLFKMLRFPNQVS